MEQLAEASQDLGERGCLFAADTRWLPRIRRQAPV